MTDGGGGKRRGAKGYDQQKQQGLNSLDRQSIGSGRARSICVGEAKRTGRVRWQRWHPTKHRSITSQQLQPHPPSTIDDRRGDSPSRCRWEAEGAKREERRAAPAAAHTRAIADTDSPGPELGWAGPRPAHFDLHLEARYQVNRLVGAESVRWAADLTRRRLLLQTCRPVRLMEGTNEATQTTSRRATGLDAWMMPGVSNQQGQLNQTHQIKTTFRQGVTGSWNA